MEEDCQDVVDLVTIAAQLTEEAKKAEAHARASKAYARKVTKESNNASTASVKLLKLSSDLLRKYLLKIGLYLDDDACWTPNLLQRELNLFRYQITPEQVLGLLDIAPSIQEDVDFLCSDFSHRLKLSDDQMKSAMDIIETEDSRPEDISDQSENEKNCDSTENWREKPPNNLESLTVRFSGSVMLQTPAVNVATKRRSRKRKTTSVNATSPLISENDILFYKRSTSPSPSVTSQGYYVPIQHKYTVQRNRSTTSQKTIHSFTDDEAPSGSDKEDVNF